MKRVLRSRISLIAIACLFFAGMIVSSREFRKLHAGDAARESLLYIPSGKSLSYIALGYDQVFADFLWLRTISYFGSHAMTDRKYPWLRNLLEAVTELDPDWSFPYVFAGVLLSSEANDVEESNRLVRRGMDHHPDVWELPFYIGFNYFHILKNPRCGAQYMFKASSYPKSPPYLKALAARLSAKGSTFENHLELCQRLLEMTKDPDIKKQVETNCRRRLAHTEPEELVDERPCI